MKDRLINLIESLGLNVLSFSKALGVSDGTTRMYTTRGSKPGADYLEKIIRAFARVNIEWLLTGEGSMFKPEAGVSIVKAPPSNDMPVVTVDSGGKENIVLVNTRAQAGYPTLHQQPEFYRNLPVISIPLPKYRNATFRAWEVVGPSMQPSLHPESVVISKFIDGWNRGGKIQNGYVHVIVTQDTVLIKRLIDRRDTGQFGLMSDNEEWKTYNIEMEEVVELWKVEGALVSYFPNPRFEQRFKIAKLVTDMVDLEERLKRLEQKNK